MQYFFSNDKTNDKIVLPREESKHCVLVLRYKIGDIIYVANGKGTEFTCEIIDTKNSLVELKVVDKKEKVGKVDYYIHIVIAPTKSNHRFEWFIEKAVEIGVDEISFIECSNSERKKINIDRVNKIALTAMKQSLKTYLPKINNIDKFSNVISKTTQQNKYIGYLGDCSTEFLSHLAPQQSSYCLFIGPEGDFTNEEIETAVNYGFNSVLLSKSRLRTETAGVMGCMILNGTNHE